MKTTTALLTALVVATSLTAAAPAAAKLNVVTTTQDPGALARAIGGDRVAVLALAKGFQDPHFLDAKPSFMLAINKADLLISIGLDFEIGWLPPLLTSARNPRAMPGNKGHLDLSTAVKPIDAGGTANRAEGDVHPRGNPHYWLDPENGRAMARAIAARFMELDPDGNDVYAANLRTFETTLDAKLIEWAKKMAPLAGRPIVTFHKSWPYFAHRYGLDVVAYVEPKPGIQPTAQHTVEVIQTVQKRDVKIILMESFYGHRSPDQIAGHSKAKVVAVPSMVGGDERVKTYFDLFDAIIDGLVKAYAP